MSPKEDRMNYPKSWRIGRSPLAARITPRPAADWYTIRNATDSVAEVLVYDEVGWGGITANDFIRDLQTITAPRLDVRICSYGGEVWDGLACYEALRRHPAQVTTYVDGIAASIASVIAMAGDRRVIARNATMMVHNASSVAVGEASEMRELADRLDKVSDNLASVYAERAGGTQAAWRQAMNAESWYEADEAIEAGLATEIGGHDAAPAARGAYPFAARMRHMAARAPAPPPAPPVPAAPQSEADHDRYVTAALVRDALRDAARQVDAEAQKAADWAPKAETIRDALEEVRPTVDDRGWWGGAGKAW